MPESKAKLNWMRNNSTNLTIKLMHRTEADIVERLEQETNKAGYIKRLIREDIERSKK
jgi:hypothetical protein